MSFKTLISLICLFGCLGCLSTVQAQELSNTSEELANRSGGIVVGDIKYFPNPVKDWLVVKSPAVTGSSKIKVLNSKGEDVVVAVEQANGFLKMSLSDVPAGQYYISISSSRSRTDHLKIVKQQ